MDYLVYVSHDAENLQFWLWLQDYTRRFYAAPRADQVLSPPWYQTGLSQPNGGDSNHPPKTVSEHHAGKGFEVSAYEVNFDTASEQPTSPQFDKQSFISGIGSAKTTTESVQDANHDAGLKWQSCAPSLNFLPPPPQSFKH